MHKAVPDSVFTLKWDQILLAKVVTQSKVQSENQFCTIESNLELSTA